MSSKEINEGDVAPNFTLKDPDGKTFKLSEFRLKKNVILYFYPKDMTPGCTQEACDFSSNLEHFEKVNAVILGISFDDPDKHQKFIDKYKLKHVLLSDIEKKVANNYGVYQEKSLYGKKFMGIVRSTFIIGKDGKIKKIFPKVKVNGHWKEVLEFLKTSHAGL